MNRIVKTAAASVLIAATTLMAVAPASAHDHRRYRDDTGAIVAAGALGLAAGALIGNANRQADVVYRYDEPRYRYAEPRYVRPRPVYQRPVRVYEQPRPVYVERYSTFEPWTRDWYRYCSDRYRSFDAQSGTFMGYDGVRHFCVAN